MISFIEGAIEYRGERFVIVNAGGIGYRVTILPKLHTSLAKTDTKIKLFTHSQMNTREGTFDMYGFDKKGDLDLFHLLTSVPGIGPKNAMGIMATVEPQHLKAAVMNEDANYLKKVSGLGPKTAQRLIVELGNKIEYLDVGGKDIIDLGQDSNAMEALMSLGYSAQQSKEALKEAKGVTLQERVREALKILGK
ncbi:MAG: Holliday junction branch migration protein RuvA [Patescibacteria group bacterium]